MSSQELWHVSNDIFITWHIYLPGGDNVSRTQTPKVKIGVTANKYR